MANAWCRSASLSRCLTTTSSGSPMIQEIRPLIHLLISVHHHQSHSICAQRNACLLSPQCTTVQHSAAQYSTVHHSAPQCRTCGAWLIDACGATESRNPERGAKSALEKRRLRHPTPAEGQSAESKGKQRRSIQRGGGSGTALPGSARLVRGVAGVLGAAAI